MFKLLWNRWEICPIGIVLIKMNHLKEVLTDKGYSVSSPLWNEERKVYEMTVNSLGKKTDKNIFKEKDIHYASAFGFRLFPGWNKSEGLLKKIENFLETYKEENGSIPLLLEKELIQHGDILKRIIPVIKKQGS